MEIYALETTLSWECLKVICRLYLNFNTS
uniref:BLTX676 n=1 Tax=Nephila pilipes TaxID=299642 RepID=A0A076KVH4_NEPPI|nr:BLTX676 [Nephila pilipes]